MERAKNKFDLLWTSKIRCSIKKSDLNSYEKSELRSLEKRDLIETARNYYETIDGIEIKLHLTEKGSEVLDKIDCHTLSDSYNLWSGKELVYVKRKVPEIM